MYYCRKNSSYTLPVKEYGKIGECIMGSEQKLEVLRVTSNNDKERIIELCDRVFPRSLVHRENYSEILRKICTYA